MMQDKYGNLTECEDKDKDKCEDEYEDEDFTRLKEIHRKMTELIDEAEYLVRITGDRHILDRAKSYWIPHIKTALLDDTEYVGRSMVTMEDTISEIKKFKEQKCLKYF